GQLPGWRILADRRAGADVRATRNADRCDERRVRSDEAFVLDYGAMLGRAVVVARDRPGPDVHASAHLGIADIGEMVRLGAGPETARLDLDEVADVDAFAELGART